MGQHFMELCRINHITYCFLLVQLARWRLIGGLAAACFTKVFGIVFLGEARSAKHEAQQDVSALMTAPMVMLASLCCIIGLFGPFAVEKAAQVAADFFGGAPAMQIALVPNLVVKVCGISWILIVATGALFIMRNLFLRNRQVRRVPTWDCGYTPASVRRQYTASSFAQPITGLFDFILRTKKTWYIARRSFSSTCNVGNEHS
jgi:hydrogenase-4 component B